MGNKNKYTVSVGNVGNIEYTNKTQAMKCYKEYVTLSKNNEGRAAGEDVILFRNDYPIEQYFGTISETIE